MKKLGGIVSVSALLFTLNFYAVSFRENVESCRRIAFLVSEEVGIQAELICAVIEAESSWRVRAVSRRGCVGLMQVKPSTARALARKYNIPAYSLFNPADNIRLGTLYLSELFRKFSGDLILTLASYNVGPSRVSEWLRKDTTLSSEELIRKHAPRETRHYVQRTMRRLDYWKRLLSSRGGAMLTRHPEAEALFNHLSR